MGGSEPYFCQIDWNSSISSAGNEGYQIQQTPTKEAAQLERPFLKHF